MSGDGDLLLNCLCVPKKPCLLQMPSYLLFRFGRMQTHSPSPFSFMCLFLCNVPLPPFPHKSGNSDSGKGEKEVRPLMWGKEPQEQIYKCNIAPTASAAPALARRSEEELNSKLLTFSSNLLGILALKMHSSPQVLLVIIVL